MDPVGYLLVLVVAALITGAAHTLLPSSCRTGRQVVYLFALAVGGAFAGGELFGALSEFGPAINGFHLLPGVVASTLLAGSTAYAMRQAQHGREADVRESTTVKDPEVAHFLFNDTRSASLWLGIRLYVGYQWLEAGIHKLEDAAWMDGGVALQGFWERAVQTDPRPVISYGWYRNFIQYMLDNEWYSWFGPLVAIGETLIGAAMIVGLFVGIASFFGALMNFNFMLAGTASTNPVLFSLAVLLIMAWKVAGYWGLDRYLLPTVGAPWSPGRAFRHGQRPSGTPSPA